ncbi:hypothetical protein [Carboxylicivirga sp. M1479]|uniref:hypothetical protein n=1 Tax=Carboxylicivirga sp. M1479 TaxID=2594476 RepID=UPI0011779507|nr:hypothetical protein [Carboxylicivirga sp. M1479]TRX71754.1 hypothetical protein FNN09_03805 [Carboxylicivirga sp. M1479]
MKMKFISLLMIAFFTISFVGCVGDDIDDLQGQIDDINDKVTELEEAQDAALLTAIAELQAAITALETDVNSDYEELLGNLTDLETVVQDNKAAIFYGNLVTDSDYDAFVAQGAEIVTGKVVVSNEEQVAKLAKLLMIGGDLSVEGGVTVSIPLLETVAGDLFVTEMSDENAAVSFAKLASVGGEFGIGYNESLVSISAPALVLVYDGLYMMDNYSMQDVDFSALDLVGEMEINGDWAGWNSFDISATDVAGDASIIGIAGSVTVNLGVVGGNIEIAEFEGVTSVSIENEVVVGDLILNGLRDIETISIANLTEIKAVGWSGGNIRIQGLYPPSEGGGGGIGIGSASLKATASSDLLGWTNNLTSIAGDVTVSGNQFTAIDAFNNVETVGGSIDINGNGNLSSMLVFEALTSLSGDIIIDNKMKSFDGFNSLETMGYNTRLAIVGKQTQDENWEYEGECVINGFAALTSAHIIELSLNETTDFHALAALTSLTAYGYQTGITIYMQNPDRVGVNGPVQLCEIKSFLENSISEEYGSEYYDHNWNLVDPMTAIPALTSNCGGGGIGIG